jgi:hypothetical protein
MPPPLLWVPFNAAEARGLAERRVTLAGSARREAWASVPE